MQWYPTVTTLQQTPTALPQGFQAPSQAFRHLIAIPAFHDHRRLLQEIAFQEASAITQVAGALFQEGLGFVESYGANPGPKVGANVELIDMLINVDKRSLGNIIDVSQVDPMIGHPGTYIRLGGFNQGTKCRFIPRL